MRSASLLGRLCFRYGFQRLRPIPSQFRISQFRVPSTLRARFSSQSGRRIPIAGTILVAALSPAVFVKLSEEDLGDGKTGEEHMLEASRAEIRKGVPEDVHGLQRVWKTFVYILDQWVYEPCATGFRFLHLFVIFVPVIFAIPAIWIGGRKKERDNERSGTLWWYGFLVHSMERAGPAFIKVRYWKQS